MSVYKVKVLVLVDESIIRLIDKTIKEIWVNEIKKDYDEDYLLKEDSLKNSLYFHIRSKLEDVLSNNNLRIYPEFLFTELKYRADLVIVQMNTESEKYYLKDRVSEVVAVFELKYVNASNNDKATEQWIMDDIKKFKRYIQEGQLNAQFYLAVIYENERKRMNWIDQRSSKHWANGKVTELDAAIAGEEMWFVVNSYNGYVKE